MSLAGIRRSWLVDFFPLPAEVEVERDGGSALVYQMQLKTT
jgi:hypothetical protein